LVDGLQNLEYGERLKKCGLTTLLFRRLRGDMIEAYKHFKTYDQSIIPKTFEVNNRPSRKHDFQLKQKTASDGTKGIQSNSFYYRIVKSWNSLPSNVVNAPTVNYFKNRLDEHWKDHDLIYSTTVMYL